MIDNAYEHIKEEIRLLTKSYIDNLNALCSIEKVYKEDNRYGVADVKITPDDEGVKWAVELFDHQPNKLIRHILTGHLHSTEVDDKEIVEYESNN